MGLDRVWRGLSSCFCPELFLPRVSQGKVKLLLLSSWLKHAPTPHPPPKPVHGAPLQSLLHLPAPRVPHVIQTGPLGKSGIYRFTVWGWDLGSRSSLQDCTECFGLLSGSAKKAKDKSWLFFSPFSLIIVLHSVKENPLHASHMKSFAYSSCCLLHFVARSPRAQQAKETFPKQHLHPLLLCLRANISEHLEILGCGLSSHLSLPIALRLEERRKDLWGKP